ncbi:hypothetical protein C2S52_008012 [Perilla frutescens var. hirtella]|nr:hypothetical protein C2S52_008012 [Perilla frutescens var. hirtella]
MAAADIFNAFGENLLESASDAFSQLLLQLLLKASQEKKFICEEADRALLSMVNSMAPLSLFQKLGAYVGHSNFRVRAKAAVSIYYCVSKMDLNSMEESWMKALLVMVLKMLKDKLPEMRGTGYKLLAPVYLAITHFPVTPQSWPEYDFWVSETKKYWQNFSRSDLPASDALTMLEFGARFRGTTLRKFP